MLQDIASLTGGSVITDDLGITLDSVQLADLGQAKRLVIDKDNTTLVNGAGKSADIKGRVAQIRNQIADTTSDYDSEKLQERLAKLAGGVAVISVGAATEAEMKEKKARVEDALHSTRAAVEEGIVPGGGVALVRGITAIAAIDGENDGENAGINIVRRALEEPLRTIANNAGHEGAVVVENVASKKGNHGFNAREETYGDLVKMGVIDPTKVVRTALSNAASIAGLLLTTDVLITDEPEEEDAPAAGGHGHQH